MAPLLVLGNVSLCKSMIFSKHRHWNVACNFYNPASADKVRAHGRRVVSCRPAELSSLCKNGRGELFRKWPHVEMD